VRPALEKYEDQVRPLMDKEAAVFNRIAALLADDQTRLYFTFLEEEALPFYERFDRDVRAIQPGHEAIEPVHGKLESFAGAGREFVTLALSTQDLPKHLRRVEKVNDAEGYGNLANAEYQTALGNLPPDARFTQVTEITDQFARGYMRRMALGEIPPQDVADRLRDHVLPRLEELRGTKFLDDDTSQALKKVVAACQAYHRAIQENFDSVVAAFTSRRKSQAAVNRREQARRAFQQAFREARRPR
jgi:hypothetical protein